MPTSTPFVDWNSKLGPMDNKQNICGLTWSSPTSLIWVLQNLVQQSGDCEWVGQELCSHLWCYSLRAEQDLCSWWWNYEQGLHQPLPSICSAREHQTSVDFTEQTRRPGSFCWLTSCWGNQIQLEKPLPITSRQKALSHGTTPSGISSINPFSELYQCWMEWHLGKKHRKVPPLCPG